jgi:serine/threonine protein kinase
MVSGMKAIHAPQLARVPHGLFHRDLKATNVLLDRNFIPCITDATKFGLERGRIIGSIHVDINVYQSPDVKGYTDNYDLNNPAFVKVCQQSDVFSMGLIFYEILTGRAVFSQKDGIAAMKKAVMNDNARPKIPDSINPDFAQLIQRSWNARPAVRPTFDDIWNVLNRLHFELEPEVDGDVVAERLKALNIT